MLAVKNPLERFDVEKWDNRLPAALIAGMANDINGESIAVIAMVITEVVFRFAVGASPRRLWYQLGLDVFLQETIRLVADLFMKGRQGRPCVGHQAALFFFRGSHTLGSARSFPRVMRSRRI
jgi:hypothetical protein